MKKGEEKRNFHGGEEGRAEKTAKTIKGSSLV
jgi:hypothetical protein